MPLPTPPRKLAPPVVAHSRDEDGLVSPSAHLTNPSRSAAVSLANRDTTPTPRPKRSPSISSKRSTRSTYTVRPFAFRGPSATLAPPEATLASAQEGPQREYRSEGLAGTLSSSGSAVLSLSSQLKKGEEASQGGGQGEGGSGGGPRAPTVSKRQRLVDSSSALARWFVDGGVGGEGTSQGAKGGEGTSQGAKRAASPSDQELAEGETGAASRQGNGERHREGIRQGERERASETVEGVLMEDTSSRRGRRVAARGGQGHAKGCEGHVTPIQGNNTPQTATHPTQTSQTAPIDIKHGKSSKNATQDPLPPSNALQNGSTPSNSASLACPDPHKASSGQATDEGVASGQTTGERMGPGQNADKGMEPGQSPSQEETSVATVHPSQPAAIPGAAQGGKKSQETWVSSVLSYYYTPSFSPVPPVPHMLSPVNEEPTEEPSGVESLAERARNVETPPPDQQGTEVEGKEQPGVKSTVRESHNDGTTSWWARTLWRGAGEGTGRTELPGGDVQRARQEDGGGRVNGEGALGDTQISQAAQDKATSTQAAQDKATSTQLSSISEDSTVPAGSTVSPVGPPHTSGPNAGEPTRHAPVTSVKKKSSWFFSFGSGADDTRGIPSEVKEREIPSEAAERERAKAAGEGEQAATEGEKGPKGAKSITEGTSGAGESTPLPSSAPSGPPSVLLASLGAAPSSHMASLSAGASSPPPSLSSGSSIRRDASFSRLQQQAPTTYEPDAFENLVLPTFRDTFERPPRSFSRETSLASAVQLVGAYFFGQAPKAPPVRSSESGLRGHAVGRGETSEEESDNEKRKALARLGDDPARELPKLVEGGLFRVAKGKGKPGGSFLGKSGPSKAPTVAPSLTPRLALRSTPSIRIVTIGIHGWFPNPRLKTVFGEPTGTSVKFATQMHDSVREYLEERDISSFNIQSIALEGGGEVQERVEKLYTRLMEREEWVKGLERADAVFVATHSQGSVVSTLLVARLLREGILRGLQTHVLAMCAIAHGPFAYLSQNMVLAPYFSFLEAPAARELFAFQDSSSAISREFRANLSYVLDSGVKVTSVASLNDQVVPLYSALFAGVSHPGVLRAVYIDSAAFRAGDFLANLVIFAARLRNAGLEDHGLLYHVSESLAGALTGVGHSKIYDEGEVFRLAVRYHFETEPLKCTVHAPPLSANSPSTSGPAPATSTASHSPPPSPPFNPLEKRNPYLLTWALRGIVEDPFVRALFSDELSALRDAFDAWRPATKTLKDVKLKLEGIRMLRGNKL